MNLSIFNALVRVEAKMSWTEELKKKKEKDIVDVDSVARRGA